MRRKFIQQSVPNLYFRDGFLSVPGYRFTQAYTWRDTGSSTLLAEGSSLKDGAANVLAKIAVAHSSASMCLERELHLLGRLSSSLEAAGTTLRVLDHFTIPPKNGNVEVLILGHPGKNFLSRYFPPSKINDFLLPGPSNGGNEDTVMAGDDTVGVEDQTSTFDVIDIASFLEFAIQVTHCLEVIHSFGIIHREVRANAFHQNCVSGMVRFAHFGNRSVNLEQLGGPSALVINADNMEEGEKRRVKDALSYLAPEQTGGLDTIAEDHRTDLYSLGVLFWTLLVGHGSMPFEGGPMELLHAIVQKKPLLVNEARRDVPEVIANIIDKLLAKNPDSRYNSAIGLKADLLECQKRLNEGCASTERSLELIPLFEVGKQDTHGFFTIPNTLFGRDKELEVVRAVMRNVSASHTRHYGNARSIAVSASGGQSRSSAGTNTGSVDDHSETASSRSEASSHSMFSSKSTSEMGVDTTSMVVDSEMPKRSLKRTKGRVVRTRSVIVAGPAGIGKTSLVMANQRTWRSHGLWGHAKFLITDTTPYSGILACLSGVLRQLMVFPNDLNRFVDLLRQRLGTQILNVPLLYNGAPEMRDVLASSNLEIPDPEETLSTAELRARFHILVEQVFNVLAETRILCIFLDDLHFADDPSIDLIMSLAHSKVQMLLFATVRSDDEAKVARFRSIFNHRSRTTWISLEPLNHAAVSAMISRTLHRSKDDCAPLTRIVHRASQGNVFAIRNLLSQLVRQNYIHFHWSLNCWRFNLDSIEKDLVLQQLMSNPGDIRFLVSHLKELPTVARKYLIWASFFGTTFKVADVALMIDWEDSSGSDDSGGEDAGNTPQGGTKGSMHGLHIALAEGWVIQRGRDMCSFAHDSYLQAALSMSAHLPDGGLQKMSFKIALMLMHGVTQDTSRIAEYGKRCISLIKDHPMREEFLKIFVEASGAASIRGAHESALGYSQCALELLPANPWATAPDDTLALYLKIAALLAWKGDTIGSCAHLTEVFKKAVKSEDRGRALRLRSRNKFVRKDFHGALDDTVIALRELGISIHTAVARQDADVMFEMVKQEILSVGFDHILSIPRTRQPEVDLAVALLNECATHAYWETGEGFSDIIGLTTLQLALRSGVSPGTAVGIMWALGAAAERRELYRFAADLGKLALKIAAMYGTATERCRVEVLYVDLVSPYDSVHLRANGPRCERAIKLAHSAGDRIYAGFAAISGICTKIYVCDHLSEVIVAAEGALNDVQMWTSNSDNAVLATALVKLSHALAGHTVSDSAATVFDTLEGHREYVYERDVLSKCGRVALNWYHSFKLVALFCLGWFAEAAELGFEIYETRSQHPNRRHIRYALFFHSLALVQSLREVHQDRSRREKYRRQIDLNQAYIRRWCDASPINNAHWVALVDAEVAGLENRSDALKLYDIAVKTATDNDYMLEEGWALYLEGCYLVRKGVENLGAEMQRRGIERQSHWGAYGIVNQLRLPLGDRFKQAPKRVVFTADAAVQTDGVLANFSINTVDPPSKPSDDEFSNLTIEDLGALAAILRWSQAISTDVNLSSSLQRLTELAAENSGAQCTTVVIKNDEGEYVVATDLRPPNPCRIIEHPMLIREIDDPLQRNIIQHTLLSKESIYLADASADPRFAPEAMTTSTPHNSVICLPIISNRGQIFGTLYLTSRYPFTAGRLSLLTLLAQQASISIANALLFRSVQQATRANIQMISTQQQALEDARRSREAALKATKIKSNFLASMSHELRTPFSCFYGFLQLLSETHLDSDQRELVQIARQSCELLLEIIDSLLDYSKLEASAVKLEYIPVFLEDVFADCIELLLTLAIKKGLDLTYHMDEDVPLCVMTDSSRIRQVLMNLLGNGLKFTATGSVRAILSVDRSGEIPCAKDEVVIKCIIRDTGIGLSENEIKLLWQPFSQVDDSTTRKFGGTGLGLSICMQLIRLMRGDIGVNSQVNVGSDFWFRIPVKLHQSDETKEMQDEILQIRQKLLTPVPPRILVASSSFDTITRLSQILAGFDVVSASLTDARGKIRHLASIGHPLDFIIYDEQSNSEMEALALYVTHWPCFDTTRLVQLYTPTAETLGRRSSAWAVENISNPMELTDTQLRARILRVNKPPRSARILQLLASVRDQPQDAIMGSPHGVNSNGSTPVENAFSDVEVIPAAEFIDSIKPDRTVPVKVAGNVLVAEDNPIAQKLLVKQLTRCGLTVTPTSDGVQAIAEWERHEPGYFSVALFDHHMPICDGVEATRRIRLKESKRKVPVQLPIVALSADCQDSTKELCMATGMTSFFSKPLRQADVKSLLAMFGRSEHGSTS